MVTTGTYGIGGGTAYLIMQTDGNVVIYDSSGPIWARTSFPPQKYAQEIMFHYGWNSSKWPYLDQLWQDESGWRWYICNIGPNETATYPSCINNPNYKGDAYGIPQADPGYKMASVYLDWATSQYTQIIWGMQYIKNDPLYGTPEAAFEHATAGCAGGNDCHGYIVKGVS